MPRVLHVTAPAKPEEFAPALVELGANRGSEGEVTVAIRAAGINPSDAKAMMGLMPSGVWPRTPGRDFAGIVVEGPREWIGREVWGSGGDVGISRNGSHGEALRLPVGALSAKPANLTMEQAGTVGVPFVTAYEGLRRAGLPERGDTVAVFGASGKVGQAVVQLATRAGAQVFAVDRRADAPRGHAQGPVRFIDASREDAPGAIRDATQGRGARIVFNTVGSPYFAEANATLAKRGTQVFIATVDRAVPFDIFAFYRGMHTYAGIDTLALPATECAAIFDALRPGFEEGSLRPFAVEPEGLYPLERAAEAYRRVLQGSAHRLAFIPGDRA